MLELSGQFQRLVSLRLFLHVDLGLFQVLDVLVNLRLLFGELVSKLLLDLGFLPDVFLLFRFFEFVQVFLQLRVPGRWVLRLRFHLLLFFCEALLHLGFELFALEFVTLTALLLLGYIFLNSLFDVLDLLFSLFFDGLHFCLVLFAQSVKFGCEFAFYFDLLVLHLLHDFIKLRIHNFIDCRSRDIHRLVHHLLKTLGAT